MKSPGVIYRRYRQLKRKLLYEKILKARKVSHTNCYYGRLAEYTDPKSGATVASLKVCVYGCDQNSAQLPTCTCPKECNAFASRWTKEKVEEEFDKELSDWETKNRLYPELLAFEWVLDKDLTEAIKYPNNLGKIIVSNIMLLEKLLKYVNRTTQKNNAAE